MPGCTFTQSRCHINLSALKRNFMRCGSPASLMPVIKSDAYGHGLMEVAKALAAQGAQRFALGCIDEGRFLREAGLRQMLLPLMPPLTADEWQQTHELGITALIGSFESLEQAAHYATPQKPLQIAIKIETGMHRLGFQPESMGALIDILRSTPSLQPVMAISHCSCADMPEQHDYTAKQIRLFKDTTLALYDAFPSLERSLFNSAGNLTPEDARFEVSRPGISLFGGNPFFNTHEKARGEGFEWVLSLSAPILQVTELKKGQTVSYGRIFTAPKDMRLAVIGAGYATAIPRILSNNLDVVIHGQRAPEVGRVCMNMMMIDVTHIDNVQSGDLAWILGGPTNPGVEPVTAQEWADALHTIPYEILCIIGAINPRIYYED